MFFKDVIGHHDIKERLIRSVAEERVSHALLFSGQEGTGSFGLALAFAQYVSCRNRGETDSCGTCPSCHKYMKLIHPDLHFVYPVISSRGFTNPVSDNFIKDWREFALQNQYFSYNQWLSYIGAENQQGVINKFESEAILRKLSLKSFESEYKVMIIWLPEKMNLPCANKLLKLIEEPPNKTLFLLVTENEEQIISTIRSRTQLIYVPAIDNNSLKTALEQMEGVTPEMAAEATNLAAGNYLKAVECLYPDEDNLLYFNKLQELMRYAWTARTDNSKILDLMKWADDMAGLGREKQKNFFEFSLRLIREYFFLNFKNDELVRLNKNEMEWGKKFSPFINERNIIPISSEFDLGFKHIAMNGNARIIFLDTALKMVRLVRQ
jgi:DNA polymerase III subunit delta'